MCVRVKVDHWIKCDHFFPVVKYEDFGSCSEIKSQVVEQLRKWFSGFISKAFRLLSGNESSFNLLEM